jgi:hypothetical protein
MEKKCIKCGEIKPYAAFPADRGKKDGLFVYCRECNCALTRAYIKTLERRKTN